MNENLVTTDVFVPRGQEKDYLDSHEISIARLANGATLATALERSAMRTSTQVLITFPSSPFHEIPPGSGISHLHEHLISNRPAMVAKRYEAKYNARTNYEGVQVMAHGPGHPGVRDYGLWPVISAISKELASPLGITEGRLASEKRVVIGEMRENQADHQEMARRAFCELVFHPLSPENNLTIGTEAGVMALNLEQLRDHHRQTIIPLDSETMISVFGSSEMRDELRDQFEGMLRLMDGNGSKPRKVDKNRLSRLNPELELGRVYERDHKIKSGLVNLYYVWFSPFAPYSVSTFADSQVFEIASQKMFNYFRDEGLGYDADSTASNLGMHTIMRPFQLTISQRSDIGRFASELAEKLKKNTFGAIDQRDLAQVNDLSHQRIIATPVLPEQRMDQAMYSLREFGRIVDTERVQQVDNSIREDDLKQSLKKFMDLDPVVLAIGDLD